MYKMCKSEQSAQRQRELEQGLLKAMGSCHYDEISVSDLCDQMGIPRKSFYRYFSGKDGALHALIDHTLMELESFSVSISPKENRTVAKELECLFLFWKNQKPLLDALERSGLSGILVVRAVEHTLSNDLSAMHFRQQPNKTVREYGTQFGVCGLMSMVLNWHHTHYAQPPEQMAQIALQLLTKPLLENSDAL